MIEEPYLLILVPWYLFPEGAIAQLGERLLCKQEVVGSIPSGSTRRRCRLQDLVREIRNSSAGGIAARRSCYLTS